MMRHVVSPCEYLVFIHVDKIEKNARSSRDLGELAGPTTMAPLPPACDVMLILVLSGW